MPLTYKEAIRIAKDFGYTFWEQKGSHQRYQIDSSKRITIPEHNEFKPKTGKSILGLIAEQNGTTVQELIEKYHIKL